VRPRLPAAKRTTLLDLAPLSTTIQRALVSSGRQASKKAAQAGETFGAQHAEELGSATPEERDALLRSHPQSAFPSFRNTASEIAGVVLANQMEREAFVPLLDSQELTNVYDAQGNLIPEEQDNLAGKVDKIIDEWRQRPINTSEAGAAGFEDRALEIRERVLAQAQKQIDQAREQQAYKDSIEDVRDHAQALAGASTRAEYERAKADSKPLETNDFQDLVTFAESLWDNDWKRPRAILMGGIVSAFHAIDEIDHERALDFLDAVDDLIVGGERLGSDTSEFRDSTIQETFLQLEKESIARHNQQVLTEETAARAKANKDMREMYAGPGRELRERARRDGAKAALEWAVTDEVSEPLLATSAAVYDQFIKDADELVQKEERRGKGSSSDLDAHLLAIKTGGITTPQQITALDLEDPEDTYILHNALEEERGSTAFAKERKSMLDSVMNPFGTSLMDGGFQTSFNQFHSDVVAGINAWFDQTRQEIRNDENIVGDDAKAAAMRARVHAERKKKGGAFQEWNDFMEKNRTGRDEFQKKFNENKKRLVDSRELLEDAKTQGYISSAYYQSALKENTITVNQYASRFDFKQNQVLVGAVRDVMLRLKIAKDQEFERRSDTSSEATLVSFYERRFRTLFRDEMEGFRDTAEGLDRDNFWFEAIERVKDKLVEPSLGPEDTRLKGELEAQVEAGEDTDLAAVGRKVTPSITRAANLEQELALDGIRGFKSDSAWLTSLRHAAIRDKIFDKFAARVRSGSSRDTFNDSVAIEADRIMKSSAAPASSTAALVNLMELQGIKPVNIVDGEYTFKLSPAAIKAANRVIVPSPRTGTVTLNPTLAAYKAFKPITVKFDPKKIDGWNTLILGNTEAAIRKRSEGEVRTFMKALGIEAQGVEEWRNHQIQLLQLYREETAVERNRRLRQGSFR
jgi:hypothetical protein